MANLHVESLSVSLAPSLPPLLHDISFSLPSGERRALIGRSGAGKSLLASAITGLLRSPLAVTQGKVSLDGLNLLDTAGAGFRPHRGQTIFHLLQNPGSALSPCLRVRAQVLRAAGLHDLRSAAERADEALRTVGLSPYAHRYPFELSGGMRQRVLMAMALVLNPSIWIADEPTTGLDPITRSEILDCLDLSLQTTCASLLFISHDLRAAARLCPQAIVLDRGRIVAQTPWDRLCDCGPEALAILDATRRLER
jgi:peptide/nickel transport system ATP-binding protein